MQVREVIARHPQVVTAVAGAAVVLGVVLVIFQMRGNAGQIAASDRAYYTVDDGKTWFPDDAKKVPPFDHQGKPAVRCSVYNVNGKETATYLTKYPDDVRAAILKDQSEALPQPAGGGQPGGGLGMKYVHAGLVKRPGDATWMPMSDAKSQALMQPPPEGIPVTPE
jgi:hypothetical protein